MESTHVYWIPLYELLASRGIGVLLVNARQLREDLWRFAEADLTRTAVSGGKPLPRKKSGGLGSNRVAAALRMAAVALQRSHSALGAAFRRISRHKDYRVAVFATARKLAQLVYRMLRWGQDYVDIGDKAYELRFRQERIAGMKRTAESLGYELVPQTQPPM